MRHILIVEDDPYVLDVLQTTLELEYHVSSANSVGEALAFLRTSHVDIVLVDSVLPDGRGNDVASFAARAGTAVVSMSGYPEEMVDLERGAQRHLCKPFGVKLLLTAVEHALHERG